MLPSVTIFGINWTSQWTKKLVWPVALHTLWIYDALIHLCDRILNMSTHQARTHLHTQRTAALITPTNPLFPTSQCLARRFPYNRVWYYKQLQDKRAAHFTTPKLLSTLKNRPAMHLIESDQLLPTSLVIFTSIRHFRASWPVLPWMQHRRYFVSIVYFCQPLPPLLVCSYLLTLFWPWKSCPGPIVRLVPSFRRFLAAYRRRLTVLFSSQTIRTSDFNKAIWCLIPRVPLANW